MQPRGCRPPRNGTATCTKAFHSRKHTHLLEGLQSLHVETHSSGSDFNTKWQCRLSRGIQHQHSDGAQGRQPCSFRWFPCKNLTRLCCSSVCMNSGRGVTWTQSSVPRVPPTGVLLVTLACKFQRCTRKSFSTPTTKSGSVKKLCPMTSTCCCSRSASAAPDEAEANSKQESDSTHIRSDSFMQGLQFETVRKKDRA